MPPPCPARVEEPINIHVLSAENGFCTPGDIIRLDFQSNASETLWEIGLGHQVVDPPLPVWFHRISSPKKS